jgi:hypothetical protein
MSFFRRNTSRPESDRAKFERQDASNGAFIRFPDKPHPHTMLLVFEEYDYKNFASFKSLLTNEGYGRGNSTFGISPNRQSGVSLRSMKSVELPFPKQLQDSNALIVNGFQRDPLIEGLTQQINNFTQSGKGTLGDIPGQIQAAGAATAKALGGLMSGGGNAGAAIQEAARAIKGTSTADAASASMYLLRKVLPDAIGRSVNLATGQVLNPRETLAFEGVQLRQHQFNWDLYPNNQQDSARIQEIINLFKRSVLPVTQDLGSGAPGQIGIAEAFLRYPHICKIYLLGVDSEYYMKFKPAMVTNFTVDYGAGGTLGIMQGGRPAGVNISISLQELQIETANDYGATSPPASPPMTVDFFPPQAGEQ